MHITAVATGKSSGRRYYHPPQKAYATFLKTSELTLIEVEGVAAGGNALNHHKTYDEHFVVLEGTPHNFCNPTGEPTASLVELRPGSAGFEKATDGTPKNRFQLAVLLQWSEIRRPGVLTRAEPLFGLLAKWARRTGSDRDPEARYCR
jgi:hypothetical protein